MAKDLEDLTISQRIDEILKELENEKVIVNEQKLKILIIDDSDTARRAIIRSLSTKKQIEFIEARNGIEGFMQLGRYNSNIDLIFLDYNMPIMNGSEFLQKGNEAKV
ncbi:MAG TPA: response regulator, partial [bacterium]|nr:response regulator [bacterium]